MRCSRMSVIAIATNRTSTTKCQIRGCAQPGIPRTGGLDESALVIVFPFRVVALYTSRDQFLDHAPMNVSQAEIAACVAVSELLMIEAQKVQNRGVEVVHVNPFSRGGEAELV